MGGIFGGKDKGDPTYRARQAAENERGERARAKSRKILGFDRGDKIGGDAPMTKPGANNLLKKKKTPMKSVLSDVPESDMKKKSMPGEENMNKKSLLGV